MDPKLAVQVDMNKLVSREDDDDSALREGKQG